MSRSNIDSYTGTVLSEESYVSPIQGINKPRTLFKDNGGWKCGAQYRVYPADYGWKLVRQNTADHFFPIFETEEIAVRVMDWCVRNDASVELAIGYLLNGDLDPFFRLLEFIGMVMKGEEVSSEKLKANLVVEPELEDGGV